MAKKKSSKKKTSKKNTQSRAATSSNRNRRPYPPRTLEEALKVPLAIREQNNGHPWSTEEVAKAALGTSKGSDRFFYLAAASRDYGLTTGSRDTEQIELAELGRSIFYAPDEEAKQKAQIEAFFNIDIFKKVFTHYGGSSLPQQEFVKNTLERDFSLPGEYHDEFIKIYKANCEFLGIENELNGTPEEKAKTSASDAESSDVRVVGEAKGKFDRTAFVIMPFTEKGDDPRPTGFFEEVLSSLITPAGNKAGFAVETAEKHGSDVIHSTIINEMMAADLVIADLTDHNPNVLFELGVCLAKEVPVALIKSERTGPVFDVDNLIRVQTYSPNLWASTIKQDVPKLSEHIKATWDNAGTSRNYMQILTGSVQSGAAVASPMPNT